MKLPEESLSRIFCYAILQCTFVEEVIGNICDDGVTAVLSTKDDAGLTLSLKADKQRQMWLHSRTPPFVLRRFQNLLLLQSFLLEVERNNWRQLQRISHGQKFSTIEL